MKKIIFLTLFLFFHFTNSNAQITVKRGYDKVEVIDNTNRYTTTINIKDADKVYANSERVFILRKNGTVNMYETPSGTLLVVITTDATSVQLLKDKIKIQKKDYSTQVFDFRGELIN